MTTRAFCIAAMLLVSAACAASPAGVHREEVKFPSGAATLAGTLFLPGTPGRHPAVVLYHGSGPQPRDSARAEWFAEQGVAALAYDKRGVGESTGDFRKIPFPDLVEDGLAAIAFLKARNDIDGRKIGVWGLSQGGWLGPLAASRSTDVAFVIAVSGPGVSPGEQMIFYYANELRDGGLSEAEVEEAGAVRRQIWKYLSTGAGYSQAKTAMESARTKSWYSALSAQHDDLAGSFQNARSARHDHWYKTEMNCDPVATLRKVKAPALFLFGADDRLVPAARSAEIIRHTLTESGHRDFTVKVFPGADHGLHSPPGSSSLTPEYEPAMQAWLRSHL